MKKYYSGKSAPSRPRKRRSKLVGGRVASPSSPYKTIRQQQKASDLALIGADTTPRATAGFLSKQLPPREATNLWFIYMAEFLGCTMYAMARCLWVTNNGGSLIASVVPTVFGTGFADGFSYFVAIAMFGVASGGHYNPAITLGVMIMEMVNAMGFMRTDSHTSKPKPSKGHAWYTLLPFFLIQILAFLMVALLVWGFTGSFGRDSPRFLGTPVVSIVHSNARVFAANFVGSGIMVGSYLILLKLFDNSAPQIQVLRGLSFGSVRFILVLAFAPWSLALWNSSLWITLAVVSGRYSDWWLLFFPSLLGSILGVVLCIVYFFLSKPSTSFIPDDLMTDILSIGPSAHYNNNPTDAEAGGGPNP